MKKVILLVVSFLILTGCNERKENLKCVTTSVENENTIISTVDVSFSNNNVSIINMKTENKLAEKYLDYMDTFETDINNSFSEYKDKNGILINTYKTDSSVIFNMNINVENLDDEMKTKVGLRDTYSTYNDTKTNLERNGYFCE